MTEKDLIAEISGLDEQGMPKSFIGIFHEIWNTNGVVRTISENTFFKPDIEIFLHMKYLQVDFKFKTAKDEALAMMWRTLEDYCKSENSGDEVSGEYPLLTVNIVPKKYNGKYYMLAHNPVIHTLQPNTVNSEPTVIRMVFDDKSFMFFQAVGETDGAEPIGVKITSDASEEG